jgi:hypothetical protein
MTSTPTSVSATTTTAATATSTSSSDKILMIKTKIENATEGLSSNCFNHLFDKVLPGSTGKENALIICNYITSSLKSEINPSDHYRKDTIILLCNLSTFFKNTKPFKEITRGFSFIPG